MSARGGFDAAKIGVDLLHCGPHRIGLTGRWLLDGRLAIRLQEAQSATLPSPHAAVEPYDNMAGSVRSISVHNLALHILVANLSWDRFEKSVAAAVLEHESSAHKLFRWNVVKRLPRMTHGTVSYYLRYCRRSLDFPVGFSFHWREHTAGQ